MADSAAIKEAREDLAAAYRLAVTHGFHEGICNHFSLAVPGTDDLFLLNPYGMHFSEITASNLLVVDKDGNKVEGEGFIEPTGFFIHSAIHRSRPDAKCVLHTHMPYALALTMVEGGRLEMADQNACRFYDRIAYDDYFGGVALATEEGDRIAAALGDKRVMFMANHGITVVGDTVAAAWEDLYYLHRACQAQVLAMSTGRPLKRVPDEMAKQVAEQVESEAMGATANYRRHFAAMKRLLERDQPDYKH
tara:strand:+ start:871 stop:1617 length:747 start_codon:yes stop_codon:yes gene_type:complete